MKRFTLDKVSKEYYNDSVFMKELNSSKTLAEVENENFDVVYLAGYDEVLAKIIEGEKPLATYLFTNENDEKDKLLNRAVSMIL